MRGLIKRVFRSKPRDLDEPVSLFEKKQSQAAQGLDIQADGSLSFSGEMLDQRGQGTVCSELIDAPAHFSDEEKEFIYAMNRAECKGLLPSVVKQSDMSHCVVVDMSYGSVHIMATSEYQSSGPFLSIVSELERKHYQVAATVSGTAEAVEHVYQIGAQKDGFMVSGEDADDMRYARIYDDIMTGAYRLKASDVHFEVDEEITGDVKLRIDGRMRVWKSYDPDVIKSAVTAAFGSRTKRGTNSGGTFSIERGMSTITRTRVDGIIIEGRFSSLPTTDGGDIVCRVIVTDPNNRTKIRDFEALGFAPSHCELLQNALERRSGLFIVAGETGSGKSTMLQSAMFALQNKDELKRFAIEDPAEYDHPGVRRITVQRGPDDPEEVVKQKFMATLRQLMRMDPDVLLLGEIRDQQTAEIASEFVQTGHRLLTTTHGDGCIDVLSRLAGRVLQMPEETLSLRKFLSVTAYQTLLPVLCDCKLPAVKVLGNDMLATIETKFGLDPQAMACANPDGCEKCRLPGIAGPYGTRGRTVAAEIFDPDDKARSLIARRNWNGVERLWRSRRRTDFTDPDMTGKTAFEHGLYKASQGIVDIRDVEQAFEALRTYQVFPIGGQEAQ